MAKRSLRRTFFHKNHCLAVINSLVDAGAETAGSEAVLTVLLEHWSHPDEFSIRALDTNLRQSCNLSQLAAVFLTRSIPKIERALAKNLGAYDPGALCTGVMLAIPAGLTGPLQQLIVNRPETFHATEQEGIALGLAAWHRRVDILDMLLSKIRSSTPALIPAYSHALGYCVVIPEKGDLQANIDGLFEEDIPYWHRERNGERDKFLRVSPLVLSIWSQECLEKLLENGFKPDRLTLAVAICLNGEVELIEKLVHNGGWVDDSDLDRPGPLYLSVERKLEAITKVLLNAGLSPNESNNLVEIGRSPLQKAVEDGNLEMIDLFLEYRADVNAPAAMDSGATALQLAAIQGRLGIARRLIDLEADVNASGAMVHGRTALEGAAEHGRLDMVQLLLDCGACVVGDGCLQYFKAIKFAEEAGHEVVANFLKNHREWASLDHKMWGLFVVLDKEDLEEVRSLKDLIDSSATSARSSSSSCMNGDSPEELIRLDDHSDCEDDSIQVESDQRPATADEDRPAVWDPMLTEDVDNETGIEEQLLPVMTVDSTWNRRSVTPDWNDPQPWLDTEMESGFCFEIGEEDMDWAEAQHPRSQ
ncbi:hypothetical protein CcaCcLH18_13190 [Colletotrichum camelliae]|nr:hypothetical protein CcaCcLH18_13190 [Colletotrichum camelliae]